MKFYTNSNSCQPDYDLEISVKKDPEDKRQLKIEVTILSGGKKICSMDNETLYLDDGNFNEGQIFINCKPDVVSVNCL